MMTLRNVNTFYGEHQILKNVNLSIEEGEIVGIIGPNGSGKSTLLNTMANMIPYEGEVVFQQKKVTHFSTKQWAKQIGLLEQRYQVPEYYTVFDVVMMGNYVHKKWWEFDNQQDCQRVFDVLAGLNLSHLANHSFVALSGGEQQRVMLARIVLQNPQLILLDEPTNHLDIFFQIELLKLIRQQFKTIVAVLHDLNLASMYCDKIVLLNQGEIVHYGTAQEILNEPNIDRYFNVNAKIIRHPHTDHRIISLYHTLMEGKR
ncbi:MAG: ABC transporter ATP-binding protein [Aerococcaceae bacterium]|nr:ABC transporter ATP-binding protein [Aerococcaceae bacterium]